MSHFLESLITHLALMEKVISARVRFRATLLSTLCTSTSYLPPPRRAGRSRKLDNDEINLSLTPPFSPFTARLVDGWKRAQEKKTASKSVIDFLQSFRRAGWNIKVNLILLKPRRRGEGKSLRNNFLRLIVARCRGASDANRRLRLKLRWKFAKRASGALFCATFLLVLLEVENN
jgi:hypothetical protein